ncbi:MAG: hypothetical protein AABY00_01490 [Nanoarchaeota archaeon]
MELIKEVFPEKNSGALSQLWKDEETRHLLLRQIGRALFDNPKKVFLQEYTNQLIALLSQANFSHKDIECVHVAHLMRRLIPSSESSSHILPSYITYKYNLDALRGQSSRNQKQISETHKDFGARCLVSLAFFHQALEEKYHRSASPPTHWYRDQGKTALFHAEMNEVRDNFERWEAYLSERFN